MEKCLTEVDVDIDENYKNEILGRNPNGYLMIKNIQVSNLVVGKPVHRKVVDHINRNLALSPSQF